MLGPFVFNEWRQLVGWHLLIPQPGLVQQIWHNDYDMVLQGSGDDFNKHGRPYKRFRDKRDFDVPVQQLPPSLYDCFF